MKQEYTVTVYTENQIGLLNRIAIIFSRRKININSLNTSPSEVPGIHRFNVINFILLRLPLTVCNQHTNGHF